MARLQGQRHEPDYILLFTVVILCAIGVVTVYSSSTFFALDNGLAANHYAVRQLIAALVGLICLTALMQVGYHVWYRFAVPSMFLNLGLLFIVLIPGIGISKLGGRRWLGHGSLSFQPSEFAMIILALYLAFFFSKQVMFAMDFRRGLLPALLISGLNFGLIFLEPDMGTALTLLGMALIVAIASGVRLKPLLIIIAGGTPLLIGLALSGSYRASRITAFLHPFPQTASTYQLLQGWTAITNGGWFGRGFGMSIEKTGYLPVPHIDFIFPVFVEEWGVVGAAALLAVFGLFIWRGFSIARHSADRFGAVLALGLTSIITVGTFINLGAVTGLLPVTGIPLPFISYGGTSLVMSLAATGMLLSVSRYTLDVVPSTDELAVVIPVDEARRRMAAHDDRLRDQRRPSKRVAEVRPMRPHRSRTSTRQTASHGTWRTRGETPTRAPRESARTTTGATTARRWRDRFEDSAPALRSKDGKRSTSSGRPTGNGRSNDASAANRPSGRGKSARTSSTSARGAQGSSRSSKGQAGKTWRERNQADTTRGNGKTSSKNSTFRKGR